MPGKLSTHVLDTMHGKPAAGVKGELWLLTKTSQKVFLKAFTTNADGRTDEPLLSGELMQAGIYELRFFIAEYFASQEVSAAGQFLDEVPVRFVISDATAKYHVPLLVTPWSYSTYRGS